jgi:hypothetical protein
MRLSSVAVELTENEYVNVVYQPACTVGRGSDTWDRPEWLHVHFRDMLLFGRPAAVVAALGRALTECYAAWGDGGPDGDPAGPAVLAQHERGER